MLAALPMRILLLKQVFQIYVSNFCFKSQHKNPPEFRDLATLAFWGTGSAGLSDKTRRH
jgi:hypothetical protein